MRNFGEFYNNQIETAATIVLSRTDSISQEKLDAAVALLREHNQEATLVATPWDELTGEQLVSAMGHGNTLAHELAELEHEHHHHHDEEHECCGHHHHDEEHECCGHHHDEDHGCCGHHDHGEHEHHHEDGNCCCGHDHGHDHHHHHADEVFSSWGVETARKFTAEGVRNALEELEGGEMGTVLRAKGIVAAQDGTWIHFDYVPGEIDIRTGSAAVIGRLCVIGAKLDQQALARVFGV